MVNAVPGGSAGSDAEAAGSDAEAAGSDADTADSDADIAGSDAGAIDSSIDRGRPVPPAGGRRGTAGPRSSSAGSGLGRLSDGNRPSSQRATSGVHSSLIRLYSAGASLPSRATSRDSRGTSRNRKPPTSEMNTR